MFILNRLSLSYTNYTWVLFNIGFTHLSQTTPHKYYTNIKSFTKVELLKVDPMAITILPLALLTTEGGKKAAIRMPQVYEPGSKRAYHSVGGFREEYTRRQLQNIARNFGSDDRRV